MDKKELEKIINGREAIKAIIKEGYQIDVTDEELELALIELRNIAAGNTNSEKQTEKDFTIQKFNIFQFRYSLKDRLRVKTNSEVAKVYSTNSATISQIELEGLKELYKIISRLKRKSAEEYPGMHGIRVAKINK